MSTFRHPVEIGDPAGSRFESINALVDTGATFTVAPSALLRRLGVEPVRRSTFVLADGRHIERDLGRTWVRVNGQAEIRLVVFGNEGEEPLLGADTLEGLLLSVDPVKHRLVPTPGLLMACTEVGQPMQAKRMSNCGPIVRGVARLTGPG